MDGIVTPIRRVVQAHPIYKVVVFSLGFSAYRWNANRVRDDLNVFTLQC
jgi:hypothetical protein